MNPIMWTHHDPSTSLPKNDDEHGEMETTNNKRMKNYCIYIYIYVVVSIHK
jgi:hypothetical protein